MRPSAGGAGLWVRELAKLLMGYFRGSGFSGVLLDAFAPENPWVGSSIIINQKRLIAIWCGFAVYSLGLYIPLLISVPLLVSACCCSCAEHDRRGQQHTDCE